MTRPQRKALEKLDMVHREARTILGFLKYSNDSPPKVIRAAELSVAALSVQARLMKQSFCSTPSERKEQIVDDLVRRVAAGMAKGKEGGK